ncbi:putative Cystathionine beta-lyase [Burkholderia multivorans]
MALRPARDADLARARAAARDDRGRHLRAAAAVGPRGDHERLLRLAEGGRRCADSGQRLRPERGFRPLARGRFRRERTFLRSARRRGHRGADPAEHAPHLAGVAGLGDDGSAGRARDRRGGARARRRHRDRQHLFGGARVQAVRAWRRHFGAGADQVSVGRQRRADGRDDHRGCSAAREAQACADALRDRGLRRRLLARAAQPAQHAGALRRAQQERAVARAMAEGPPGNCRGPASATAGLPGARVVRARLHGRGRAVLGDFRCALQRGADRPLRRGAGAVRDRLELGRRVQPRDALRRRVDARGVAASRHAGAVLHRSRGRGRPARGHRARDAGHARLSAAGPRRLRTLRPGCGDFGTPARGAYPALAWPRQNRRSRPSRPT